MKILNFFLAFLFITTISCAKKSPREQTDSHINGINISVDYGSPSVKGRKIWGKLVKYNKVWRAGANENTTISFDKDVKINGKSLAAGKYGFFIIPKENSTWTIIFNKENSNWGAFKYKQKEDALRVEIQPELVNDNQEQLHYSIENKAIIFTWEKVRISMPIE